MPAPRAHVEESRARGHAPVDEPFARPAKRHELFERHEFRRVAHVCGLALREPAQFARRQHRVDRRTRRRVERVARSVGAPAVRDFRGTAIHPRDERPERFAVCVHGQHAVHRAREADRRDVVAAQAHFGKHVVQGAHRRTVDLVRVLLDEFGMRRQQRVRAARARDDAAARRAREHFHRARPEIDADEERPLGAHVRRVPESLRSCRARRRRRRCRR